MRPLLFALALFATTAVFASDTTQLVAGSASRLVLLGSSNVKDWRCSGATLDGRMEVAAPLDRINSIIDRIEDGDVGRLDATTASFPQPKFDLRVPVESLRCGNRQMERDMYKALRADANPVIEFQFKGLVGGIVHDIDARRYRATVAGVLVLAGARRNVQIPVEAERISRDRFRLRARLPLRMTDFNVVPPTALFGMVKAKNELVVQFELILGARV